MHAPLANIEYQYPPCTCMYRDVNYFFQIPPRSVRNLFYSLSHDVTNQTIMSLSSLHFHTTTDLNRDGDSKKSSIRDERRIPRKRKQLTVTVTSIATIAAACLLYWYGFIWRTQRLLDSYLQRHELLQDMVAHVQPPPIYPIKFLYFLPIRVGQGTGNIISGLLAAHLLGDEFGRIVCVSSTYKEFLMAFAPINAQAVLHCPEKVRWNKDNSIYLFNFGHTHFQMNANWQMS